MHTRACARACVCVCARVSARVYAHTRTHTHTHARTHARTHAHTHAHTHTHTYTYNLGLLNTLLVTAVPSPREHFLFCFFVVVVTVVVAVIVVPFFLGSQEFSITFCKLFLSISYVFCFCFIGLMSLFLTVMVIIANTLAVHLFDTGMSNKGVFWGCYLNTLEGMLNSCACPLAGLVLNMIKPTSSY